MLKRQYLEDISTEQQEETQEMECFYKELLNHIERLHRIILDVIKNELDTHQIDDINPVQALLLYNVGDLKLTPGELKTKGYYLGSNVSYNVKKLVEMEYLSYEKSHRDKRSIKLTVTEKGKHISHIISQMYSRQTHHILHKRLIDIPGIEDVCLICKDFERFWMDQIHYGE